MEGCGCGLEQENAWGVVVGEERLVARARRIPLIGHSSQYVSCMEDSPSVFCAA